MATTNIKPNQPLSQTNISADTKGKYITAFTYLILHVWLSTKCYKACQKAKKKKRIIGGDKSCLQTRLRWGTYVVNKQGI